MDATAYARSIGYSGTKPVRIVDGRVVSHRNVRWGNFCDRIRRSKRQIQYDSCLQSFAIRGWDDSITFWTGAELLSAPMSNDTLAVMERLLSAARSQPGEWIVYPND